MAELIDLAGAAGPVRPAPMGCSPGSASAARPADDATAHEPARRTRPSAQAPPSSARAISS